MKTPAPSDEEEIFLRAVGLAGDERVVFLETACGGQPALRARLDQLLAWENDDSFLQSSPFSHLNAEMPRSATEDVGALIGPYRLLEELGAGGFGTVWRAQQEQPVRRQVALKIVKLGMDTKEVMARFEQERQALALMEHPSIARVFDAGATQAGRPFFVMELVRGVRITDYCDAQNLTVAQRLDLFIQVCQAVQHAHQKGVIHRDLKPSNILVAEQDGMPLPKVIDFGVAKATEERLTELTLVTQVHQRVGTPLYMSPEQAAGGVDIDTRADIYALGVLLYELLTGCTPFDDSTKTRAGADEALRISRERGPKRPSTMLSSVGRERRTGIAGHRQTDGPRLLAEVRGDLDWIVLKALEHDRARRYATANGLAMDIRRHLAHEPVLARPQSGAYRLRRLVRRNRLAFAAGLAVATALLAGAIVSTWQAVRARRAESEQRGLREQAEAARALARVRAYAADMKAASVMLLENNLGGAKESLLRHVPAPNEPDLRGIEWRYLWQAARGDELRTMRADRIMSCAAVSPDGRFIAGGGLQGDVQIWKAADEEAAPLTLEGPKTMVPRWFIAFSPAGKFFASVLDDAVVVRETDNWRIVRKIDGPHESLAFSPDGKTLSLASARGVWLHDTASWEGERLSANECSDRSQMHFASDGSALAVLPGRGNAVTVWEIASRRLIGQFQEAEANVGCAISPDGRRLAVGTMEGQLMLWDLVTRRLLRKTKAHSGWVVALEFSADGRVLVTGGGDQNLTFWNASGEEESLLQPLFRLRGHRNEIWDVAWSLDGQRLVTSSKDGTVKLWPAHPPVSPDISFEAAGDQLLGLSADTRTVRTLTPQGEFRIWSADDGKLVRTFPLPASAAPVAWPDGAPPMVNEPHLFFGTTTGTLETWSLEDGKPLRSVALAGGAAVTPLRISEDERLLFAFDQAKQCAGLWDVPTGERLAEFGDFDYSKNWASVGRAAFSPAGNKLAYAARDFSVKLWDTGRRTETHVLRGHFWRLFQIGFAADGQRLATASWDGTVRVWDSATGALAVPPLRGHLAGVESISFSPDNRTLLTAGGEGIVRFWSTATGAEMLAMAKRVLLETLGGHMLSADGNAITWQDAATGRMHVLRLPALTDIDAEILRGRD